MGFFLSHHKLTTFVIVVIIICGVANGSGDNFMSIEVEDDGIKGDLLQAETKDAKASEIIKHIRKVNDDGTYTVGFETDDGTFKIESRDVLGNIKGTFGYIDDKGEIKRISYTTTNTTGLKEPTPAPIRDDDENDDGLDENETIIPSQTTHKYNRTYASATRRPPSLNFLTSTTNPVNANGNTKSSVIQSIPKRRIILPSERSTLKNNDGISVEPTTTIVYATSVPTTKPYSSSKDQIARPEKIEIDHVSKVSISNQKEKKHEIRGNLLRRQLKMSDNEEGFEAQQQVLYSQSDGEDGSVLYGNGFGGGGVRPLYSSTPTPKIPHTVLAARQRAAQIQTLIAANASPSTTTEKVYVKPPKRQSILKAKIDDTIEPTSGNFLTQNPLSLQIPANKEETEAADEQRRELRERPISPQIEQLYRPRSFLRQLQQQQQQKQQLEGEQPRGFRIPIPQGSQGFQGGPGSEQFGPTQPPINAQRFAQQYAPQSSQLGADQTDESYPASSPYFPPQGGIPPVNPYRANPYDNYDRPLTVRDFERLLQLLIFRQNQFGRYNPYYQNGPTNFPPFVPPFNAPPYQQIPRPPPFYPGSGGNNFGLNYDPYYRNINYSPSSQIPQQYDRGEGSYQPSRPIESSTPFDVSKFQQPRLRRPTAFDPRLIPESNQASEQELNYNSLQQGAGNADPSSQLPSSVREQILYRMLMLALQSDPQLAAASDTQAVVDHSSESSKEINKKTKVVTSSKKPIRSVQILGEEDEESQEQSVKE
jgi:hypothetical protein